MFIGLKSAIRIMSKFGTVKNKRARLSPNSTTERSYFESYADITVHEEMLGDEIRTNAYKNAIFSMKKFIEDKVVLDVGAGTGILSCFCAQAGAKKVFAVEASSIAEQARNIVLTNGLENQIEVIHGLVEEISLPEKVDVIVSEWMGYCLLYESMLSSVITARDRWLKPGGIMLPNIAAIYIAPVHDDDAIVERINFWGVMNEVYGVDMSSMLSFARKSIAKEVMVKTVSCENILSKPQLITHLNLNKVTQEDIEHIQHEFTFNSFGIGNFQGFALWFDVFFPCKEKLKRYGDIVSLHNNTSSKNEAKNIPCDNTENDLSGSKQCSQPAVKDQFLMLSTSPYDEETHWKQAILYLDKEFKVLQDSTIKGSITLCPNETNRRFLNIEISCCVDKNDSIEKSFLMGYEVNTNDRTA